MPQGDETPLMRQWREVKARHDDALVFFRVGDFYELFNQDAREGSRLLGLTLTSRNNGGASAVPLAGIPVKALDDYLARLVKAGRRVAICEQVEDPDEAKGIVRREVVETITPGTVLQDALLRAERNNFLVAVTPVVDGRHGVAALDLSTGEVSTEIVPAGELEAELGRLEAQELLLPRSLEPEPRSADAPGRSGAAGAAGTAGATGAAGGEGAADAATAAGLGSPAMPGGALRTYRDDWIFETEVARDEILRRYGILSLEGLGFQKADALLVRATGALIGYVREIRPAGAAHLRLPTIRRPGNAMVLDEMTRRNLELVEPLRSGEAGGTLVSVLDETVTAMGARLLRQWILRPLVAPDAVWERQDAVEELHDSPELRRTLRQALGEIADLERLAGKLGSGRIAPRELLGLGRSLAALPAVRDAVAESATDAGLLQRVGGAMDLLEDVRTVIETGIAPESPVTLQEGGVIRAGYDASLDELREVRDGARDFIARLQVSERETTGINSLKVGFNRVFGYYLEVTRANLDRVPERYVRKQTLANAERFFTPELKEWEEKIMGAEEGILALETELFGEIRRRVAAELGRLQETGARVAVLDVLATLAVVAERRHYVRPELHTGFELAIRAGRHPVVETMMPREAFIPNDLLLDGEGRIIILTGPNMAGKSTVLRQVGLIQLLAQIGSFVPADAARLPFCDRIFTRVGASDNLARGQSTFMVEMNETAAIIHGATASSLVLLDEIGRGTSTYDGVSIAWAVTEHLHETVGAKTIFATHYHELTQLGDLLGGVKNMNVAVREAGEEIVFLRRLEAGGADRSYGIQVARLAGFPPAVLARARELLSELEGTHSGGGEGLGRFGTHAPDTCASLSQLSLFREEHALLARIRSLDIQNLTPLDALNVLSRLQSDAQES